MQELRKRKALASKVLRVGKNKIIFDSSKLAEIKEAITKQDIRDLYEAGIISIRETRGKKTIVKRTTKKGPGKTKRKVHNRKRDYMILVRKLRRHVRELKTQGRLPQEAFEDIRKKIRAKTFKNKAHLKEYLKEYEK
jgi:large subunit ribosomal protein L19e